LLASDWQRQPHTVNILRAEVMVLRTCRLGALGRPFNDCREHAQIIPFCLRGAERAKTFTAAAGQAA